MDLFIDTSIQFEKKASEVPLPEDPNAWPHEILQELYKQVPYVSDFEPHVVMDKVDPERGYAFGHVEISNKSEIQHATSAAGQQAAGIKTVKIPVIVKQMKLQPFDVIVTPGNDMLPLTEPRLRQAIFRPTPFDITGKGPGDQSIIGQLYPPYRQNYGFGGGGAVSSAGTKEASDTVQEYYEHWKKGTPGLPANHAQLKGEHKDKFHAYIREEKESPAWPKHASILDRILPTINESDHRAFFQKLANPALQTAFLRNDAATTPALSKLASCRPLSVEKTAAVLRDMPPTAVQVLKAPEGYVVKMAAHYCWEPVEELLDRGEVVRRFGEKIAFDTDVSGGVTMSEGATADSTPQPEEDKYELIKDFGIYKVKDTEDRELIGYVFPNLLDLDGTPLPICLFTNGSNASVQGEIAGVSVGIGANLMEGSPRGKGVFYELLTNGRAQATIPITITASVEGAEPGDGGIVLHGETYDGRPVEVSVQPNLAKIQFQDGRLLVPETMSWLPLDQCDEIALQGDPGQISKMAHLARGGVVEIRCGGPDSFSFKGPPVEKLASDATQFLSLDDAVFLLAGLGVNPKHGFDKLAEALPGHRVIEVMTARELSTSEEQYGEAVKMASAVLSFLPNLRRDLVKEAAVIPDPSAVDTVLSLGFLNPENIRVFLSALPEIEASQKRLCELLVAARLGMQDVPVAALESAVRSTEEVIEGLKVLAFSKN